VTNNRIYDNIASQTPARQKICDQLATWHYHEPAYGQE
jgi:hypothetical protein